ILPEYREYERTSTVAINAYLQPLMGAYLKRLGKHAPALRVMQSSGGSISSAAAAREPVRTILSGPAGGVVGALNAARAAGHADIITFDMGGTSTDVALCVAGEIKTTNEATISALPVAVPVLDIHTVGAGGGSIARVDAGGSLRVGPESAGAQPGPACYGRGTQPTVTDANLVLGRFGGAELLGGDFHLDEARAPDVIKDTSRTVMLTATKANSTTLEQTFRALERQARAALRREGFDDKRQRHERSVAARYKGQSFELEIKWHAHGSLARAFHRAHEQRYGYAQAANTVEIVSARVRSAGLVEKLKRERLTKRAVKTPPAPQRFAQVYFTNKSARVAVYARESLAPGARLRAPCTVTEYSSTTLVPAGARANVDAHGN